MTPKHVMHAALVASLMTSFLVACAPSKNPKAKGFKTGTHKTAPRTDKQADLVLQKTLGEKTTDADRKLSERLQGASAAVSVNSKIEKNKKGKETETLKASVTVKAIVLNKEGKPEAVIASGQIDKHTESFKIGAVNGCGEESKYDVEVSCSKQACKILTVAIFEKGSESTKIPMMFDRVEEEGDVAYELSYTTNRDDKNEVVRNSVEEVVASLEAGALTCADAKKSTDALTAKVEGAAPKQEETQTKSVENKDASKEESTEAKPAVESSTDGETKSATEEKGEKIVVPDAEVEGAAKPATEQK